MRRYTRFAQVVLGVAFVVLGCDTTATNVNLAKDQGGPDLDEGVVDGGGGEDGGTADAPTPPDGRAPDGPEVCTPAEEVCDGLDNDCDGQTDEEVPDETCYEGPDGTRRVGVCTPGVSRCVDGAYGICEGQTLPGFEVCDGQDNDCDGVLDEDTAETCFEGDPAQIDVGICRAGTRTCSNGSLGACLGEIRAGEEICDTRDNDCNGLVDDVEGGCGCPEAGVERDCYSGLAETEGVGRCRAGRQVCLDGGAGWSVCEGEVTPVAELCNGQDDDCDGESDEGLPIGDACTVGVGICRREGQTICNVEGGDLACSATPGMPREESCNGEDDDCDGSTDEGLNVGEPCEAGVGVCLAAGEIVCNAEGEPVCSARAGMPRAERCNGLDDDCDGASDEGELVEDCYDGPVGTEGVGACRAGTRPCGGVGCEGAVLPSDEICDGLDNDCDGSTDEGIPGTGAPCSDGVGACRREGRMQCSEDGGDVVCGAVAGDPSPERCNGIDDDCDGTADEDLPGDGDACAVGVGRCRATGEMVCFPQDGAVLCDAVPGEPRAQEGCDNVDDDCDGQVDEDVPGTGNDCEVGRGACLRRGRTVCDSQQREVVCNATPGNPSVEICNDIDDDCDGTVDEGAQGVGGACTVGEGVCQREGQSICNNGQLRCNAQPGNPGEEICNDLDDDCDGEVDENAVAEVCNGIDDNCDGSVDEGTGGGACQVEGGGDGTEACIGGQLVCQGDCQPVAEACNGLDDDCDGDVDEDLACGDYIESNCKIWLAWSDVGNHPPNSPSPSWDDECPQTDRNDSGTRRCVASIPGGNFGMFHTQGNTDGDNAIGVAFSCSDGDAPQVATWIATHCAVYVGFAHSNADPVPPDGGETWGPCPDALSTRFADGDRRVRCTSSGYDGNFRPTLLGDPQSPGDWNVDDRDRFGIAFVCQDPDAQQRAAAVAESVTAHLGHCDGCNNDFHDTDFAICVNDGRASCTDSAGDSRWHHMEFDGNFDDDNGPRPGDQFGVALRSRAP